LLRKGGGGRSRFKKEASGLTNEAVALEVAQARAVFDRLVALEAAYDCALGDLYAEDGLVVETVVENGAPRRIHEIPASRYRAHLAKALDFARKADERFSHSDISLQHLGPGWVSVRSLRRSTRGRAPGPYELLIRRCADGAWRICKESATRVI